MSTRHPTAGKRRPVVPVRRSFPWGHAAGTTVLVLALVGVLGYVGSAAPDPLGDADASIKGVQVTKGDLGRNHQVGPLTYSSSPSVGGNHNARGSPARARCTERR